MEGLKKVWSTTNDTVSVFADNTTVMVFINGSYTGTGTITITTIPQQYAPYSHVISQYNRLSSTFIPCSIGDDGEIRLIKGSTSSSLQVTCLLTYPIKTNIKG